MKRQEDNPVPLKAQDHCMTWERKATELRRVPALSSMLFCFAKGRALMPKPEQDRDIT